jgi:hypothetical protein
MFSYLTRQPIILFDKDGNGGGTPDAEGNEGEPPDSEGNAGDEGKQKQLDKEFASRAKRAADAERKKLWDALGVTSQEEFDAYVKAKKEAEDAAKTEAQKLADEATKAKAKADKLEADHKAEVEKMQKRIVDTEIKVDATAEAKDKDGKVTRRAFRKEALDDVTLLIDRSKIALDEEGKVSGIPEALDALAKAKPWLLVEETTQTTPPRKPKGTPDSKLKSGGSNANNRRAEEDDDEQPLFNSL